LLPWLAFTIEGLEQGWLAQYQFKMTGGVPCLSAAWYFGVKETGFSLDHLQQI